MKPKTALLGASFMPVLILAGWAGAALPPVALELVAEGQFGAPTKVTHAGDGSSRLFVADQRGKIHILVGGAVLPAPFLDLADPDLADPESERILLTFDQPQFDHDAGQLAFGPAAGLLYIATGDGGSSNDNNAVHTGGAAARPADALGNSQDRTVLLGKILRLDAPWWGMGFPVARTGGRFLLKNSGGVAHSRRD